MSATVEKVTDRATYMAKLTRYRWGIPRVRTDHSFQSEHATGVWQQRCRDRYHSVAQ